MTKKKKKKNQEPLMKIFWGDHPFTTNAKFFKKLIFLASLNKAELLR